MRNGVSVKDFTTTNDFTVACSISEGINNQICTNFRFFLQMNKISLSSLSLQTTTGPTWISSSSSSSSSNRRSAPSSPSRDTRSAHSRSSPPATGATAATAAAGAARRRGRRRLVRDAIQCCREIHVKDVEFHNSGQCKI